MSFVSGACRSCGDTFTVPAPRRGGSQRRYCLKCQPRVRRCEVCGDAYTLKRANLTHQRYCSRPCWLQVFYRRRRERARLHKAPPPAAPLAEALDAVCWCGKVLVAVGFDWLGRTIEMCGAGHETPCVQRRRA